MGASIPVARRLDEANGKPDANSEIRKTPISEPVIDLLRIKLLTLGPIINFLT